MSFKIVTFNIRFRYDGDGVNSFIHRLAIIRNKIKAEKPDVIGFQEIISPMVQDLEECLPEYTFLYCGRDADYGGEGLALALRKDTVALADYDGFWLSETPYVPASRYRDSVCPRVGQQALVRVKKTNHRFWVFNAHLDHHPDDAIRTGQLKILLERMAVCKAQRNVPAFVMGDFNAMPGNETIDLCAHYAIADLAADCGPTFHGFGKAPVRKKIDYIFSDVDTEKMPCAVACWEDACNGIYLSDHFPICVTLEL